jgi:radical SAM protein with 4Fe4S-binding SPASM domain
MLANGLSRATASPWRSRLKPSIYSPCWLSSLGNCARNRICWMPSGPIPRWRKPPWGAMSRIYAARLAAISNILRQLRGTDTDFWLRRSPRGRPPSHRATRDCGGCLLVHLCGGGCPLYRVCGKHRVSADKHRQNTAFLQACVFGAKANLTPVFEASYARLIRQSRAW